MKRSIVVLASLLVFGGCRIPKRTTQAPPAATQPAASLAQQRRDFQDQELITARSMSYICNPGDEARIVWRDLSGVRELGGEEKLHVRWFDADLKESPKPSHSGRWGAYITATAPNRTPVVRQMTFFARPTGFLFFTLPGPTPLDYQAGVIAEPVWKEHEEEIANAMGDMRFHCLNDSETAAILLTGLSESKPLGRPAMSFESAVARNEQFDLSLRMKLEGLTPQALQPPRRIATTAPVLRDGSPAEAGVANDAKQRIDDVCRAWAKDSKEPFVTLVARHGVVITHASFGLDPATGQPLPLDGHADVFSITKTITALMFARFVDQGLLDLDDPVSKVFPHYPRNDPHVPTFRECFTHMSGLSGHGDFGGVRNPQLDNLILNGLDANQPAKTYNYSGMGFDLTAKAMELMTGIQFQRLYHDQLFAPLGIEGDIPLDDASAGGKPDARQLATLAQLLANHGRYGHLEFFSPATFDRLLPEPLAQRYPGTTTEIEGIGMHWMHSLKPGAKENSINPKDWILSPHTIGHGSLSSCMLMIDLDRDLTVVQIRRGAGLRYGEWSARFLQAVTETLR